MNKLNNSFDFMRALKLLTLAAVAVGILSGFTSCSSGSDSDNSTNVNQGGGSGGAGLTYSGPAPLTSDVQAFREFIWNNLGSDNRCGECHVQGGQGSVPFVRDDDINLAYQAALTLVDLDVPINSDLVQRVGTGHGCWDSSPAVCADLVEGWIENWANAASVAATVVTIQPVSPLEDPGSSLNFPNDTTDFEAIIHGPILRTFCGECHSEDGVTAQQQPFFASTDIDVAYSAARSRIDLNDPASSRFVRRMVPEQHNCWDPNSTGSDDCPASAAVMEQAITDFVATLGGPDAVDTTELMVSKIHNYPATPDQGQSANASGRFETNIIAKYEFKNLDALDDTRVVDTSGVEPQLDLTLSGDVDWVASWGLEFFGPTGKAQGRTSNSQKLYDAISLTGEYAIEAWVIPANVTQDGTRRMVSYSGGSTERNFTLGQTLYNYDFLNRTDSPDSDADGGPLFSTPDADEVLQASLQHVVVNFDPVNGRSIYVNGQLATPNMTDTQAGSNVSNWNNNFVFVLGNETANPNDEFDWRGTLRFVGIHNRALTPEQILANFEVGVGQKYYVPFSIEHLTNIVGSYIVFEVERFDDVSYLFNEPFFTIAGNNVDPQSVVFSDFDIRGMRIGINGRDTVPGQAFANIDITITDEDYRAAENNWLRFSSLGIPVAGTIIMAERDEDDVETDEFFLSFDSIAGNASSLDRSTPTPPLVTLPTLSYEQSDIGLKHFYEINEMYSAITGVPKDNIMVAAAFNQLRTQLPSTEDALAFGTSNQMGIAQFAAAYCEAAASDDTYRLPLWPSLVDNQAADTQRDELLQPLLARMAAHDVGGVANAHLATQADPGDVEAAVDTLLASFGAAGSTGEANVEATAIAVCTAVLASASATVQ